MGRIIGIIFVVLLGLFLLGKCTADNDVSEADFGANMMVPDDGFDSPILPPTSEGFAIDAPSDPGANYRILEIKQMANGNLEVTSRRDGSSGTSFARREIDCSKSTYRYLGEGDTLDDAKRNSPNVGTMAEITGTSASSDVLIAACARKL